MFDAGRTGAVAFDWNTTAPSTATLTHVGAGRSAANCSRLVSKSLVASCPVTTPGRRRADRSGVTTLGPSLAPTGTTAGGSPRSAVLADDVATHARSVGGTMAATTRSATRRRRPARRERSVTMFMPIEVAARYVTERGHGPVGRALGRVPRKDGRRRHGRQGTCQPGAGPSTR